MIENPNYLSSNKYLLLAVLYLVSNGIIIFNNGIFWDDWCLYNMSNEGIMAQFSGNGLKIYGYLHYFLNQFSNPTLVYNSLTIILQITTAFTLLKIVSLLKLNQKVFYLVIVLATISPFFMAKNTMICFPYTLSYFIFFTAVLLIIYSVIKSIILPRIIALGLFFFSFMVNSFIVLYILPFVVIYLLYSKINIAQLTKENVYKLKIKSLLKMTDLIILPFLFLLFNRIVLVPSGLYKESYNKITGGNIVTSPKEILKSLINQTGEFFSLIDQYIFSDFEHFILFLVLLSVTAFLIKKFKISFSNFHHKRLTFIIGILLIVLATLPYIFVQKPPSFLGYDTRHQLLLPLGVSLVIVSVVLFLVKSKNYKSVFVFFFTICITVTFNMNLQFIKGGFKQQSLVLNFRPNNFIKNNSTLMFFDKTPELDATKYEFRFYSLNGISKLAFGSEDKLICDYKSFSNYTTKNSWENILTEANKFNMSDYKLDESDGFIKITKGTFDLSTFNTFKLIFWSLTDKDKAWTAKQKIIKIETKETDAISPNFFID